ncbi:MAG: hypothetical protein A2986_01865 [Candidatus Jacksonbacteria bacterium RIFCSPLOWO2_01_FULL_44_13]|nr:MAG: hypothetical protein A2986_01865 [Candidatus Jacksonbacteria bacterium RIFCSPLOWO2_01_FULL_44_13]
MAKWSEFSTKGKKMDAERGHLFLLRLLKDNDIPMDGDDLEKAIEIASRKLPSGAFDEAQRHYITRHGNYVSLGYLTYAKGVRWLAMLRRESGQAAFDAACDALRRT